MTPTSPSHVPHSAHPVKKPHHSQPRKGVQATKPVFRPTHIKHLKTTAPKDLRASKAERAKERKETKERKKASKSKTKVDGSKKTGNDRNDISESAKRIDHGTGFDQVLESVGQ